MLYFYDVAKQYPQNFSMTFDQFLAWMTVSDHDDYTFIENFGDSVLIVVDRYGWEQVQIKMEALANDSEGRLPAFPDGTFQSYDFLHAMVDAISTITWRTVKIDATVIAQKTFGEIKTITILGLSGVALYYTLGGALGLFLILYKAKGGK